MHICTKGKDTSNTVIKALGPGLITGASDDDPSGIATYSQVGAQFGYRMLWVMLFTYPLMCGIQEISARLGRVSGRGIAGNMRLFYPKWLSYPIVFLLLGANILNLAADISAMGTAMKLLWPSGSEVCFTIFFALFSLLLQIFIPYSRYVHILKWLTLTLFAYIATAFVVHISWKHALSFTFIPTIHWNKEYILGLIAVLGTTISPYLFFWQASTEVEETRRVPREKPIARDPLQASRHFARIKLDTYIGMGISNIVAYFIILTAAATLYTHGIHNIDTAAQAAEALRPIAGHFAFVIFSLGIIGTGLLAIPVLAASAAYAVSEMYRWRTGLERRVGEARGFYSVITISVLLGLGITFTNINPIRALFWSAVINGITAAPIMAVMMLMTTNSKIMKQFTLPVYLQVIGWVATAVMFTTSIGLLFC